MKVRQQGFRACVLATVLAVIAADSAAQMRRDRGNATRDSSPTQRHDAAPSQDPFAGFAEKIEGWVRLRLTPN